MDNGNMVSPSLRLPICLAIIYGAFTLGFYVAIQGPTLMDLIDLLHVNNDIMSYSLAFASLAYSVGGLLSGFLFNYVNRQILIAIYYVVFGLANILTPFISNYYVFSVITVFKMMCAGGTDCGANVWMLELRPGQDAWLQALHFSFAVGCALGPLLVEPFLSVGEHKENEVGSTLNKDGSALINDQNNETRIHIPYAISGTASLLASVLILWLYYLDERSKRRRVAAAVCQRQAAAGGKLAEAEAIPLTSIQRDLMHVEDGGQVLALSPPPPPACPQDQAMGQQPAPSSNNNAHKQPNSQQNHQEKPPNPSPNPHPTPPPPQPPTSANQNLSLEVAVLPPPAPLPVPVPNSTATAIANLKITSKAKEQSEGRPPYYVMFAIALAALCLSFYCGIEITSMNYLATFAVNIDLQLPKSTAALMSSALTISFAIGRLFGIWIAAYVRPHKLFYLCAAVMATGNVFMLIFANTAETLLWYSICLFGIGCGPMFPAIVSFYDDKISKVTNTVSGIFILGSMFNVALNSLIIGHYIIDNALVLIICNLVGSVLLLLLFGTLHMLTKVKKQQRVRKYKQQQKLKEAGALVVAQPLMLAIQQQQQQQQPEDSQRQHQQQDNAAGN